VFIEQPAELLGATVGSKTPCERLQSHAIATG
jgi:hypothetical protein